jgi:3-dehydroquinate dehydratase-2
MTDILVINGPNLNMFGLREPEIYGTDTLADFEAKIKNLCKKLNVSCHCFQSNNEGELVTAIQNAAHVGTADAARAIVINAAAYTHTSVAIRDALSLFSGPKIEVHVSNVMKREQFRHESFISAVCDGIIIGLGVNSYLLAVHAVTDLLD